MHIKNLPENERPIEKAYKLGIDNLSNAEIIALIIHTGTSDKSAISLAEDIIGLTDNGIGQLTDLTIDDLLSVKGIGLSKAMSVIGALELGKRVSLQGSIERFRIESADHVASLFMEKLRCEKKEHFKCILVNAKGQIIYIDNVSTGELSSTVVHPREVFRQAVNKSAAAVFFVHNHPSGDPTPSTHDITTTDRLVECGNLLGISVLDHIIIGDGSFASMRDLGIIK